MNEFGVDIAFDVRLTPAMMSKLDFAIPRIGTFGYSGIGTAAYYNKQLNIDSGFAPNIQLLQSSGKYAGCYIFSYAWDVRSAQAEADRVCDALDRLGFDLSLPVFFDWERTGEGTYGSYEMVTAAGITVTAQLVRDMTLAFMQRVNDRGRAAGWYQSSGDLWDWWSMELVRQTRDAGYYLWVAQWAGSTAWAGNADVWQFSGDVQWEGIDVDKNYIINDRVLDPTKGNRRKKILLMYLSTRRKQAAVFKGKR